jgi:D-alanine-D-alanine ligase
MHSGRTTVLVLFGGRSTEHSISCVSAGSVMRAIDRERYDVVPVGITQGGAWVRYTEDPADLVIRDGHLPTVDPHGEPAFLSVDPSAPGVWFGQAPGSGAWQPIDVVFPVLHGPYGEDGTIQGMLEIAGLPYVGSGVFSSAACMDKGHTKALLADAGIPAGRWHSFRHRGWHEGPDQEVVAGLGWPLFVKPARAGSSVGVSKAASVDALHAAVESAGRHDPHVIVEASVEQAREIECGVLVGPDGKARASVCAEILVRAGHDFYDFEAKYLDDSVDLIVPADLPDDQHQTVRSLAIEAFNALQCEGLARVDFFIDPDGQIMVNEINTMPGFTAISMYPRMWAETGVDYPELIDTLISEALARRPGLR